MAEPPVSSGAVQLAVIAVDVTPLKTSDVGGAGVVASVEALPVRLGAGDDPAPLTTITSKECDVAGSSPPAEKLVVGLQVSEPPSTRTW